MAVLEGVLPVLLKDRIPDTLHPIAFPVRVEFKRKLACKKMYN